MKRTIFILSIMFALSIKAQTYVLIPDANFASYLQGLIPSAMNGNSLNITSTLVTTSTKTINCGGQGIFDLTGIQYFSSLLYLNCKSNFLATLPPLPNSLQTLGCVGNVLLNLPPLPTSLQSLLCYDNSLAYLPALPGSLQVLYCASNSLTSFPALPNSLQTLDCSVKFINSLPALPNSLTTLLCNNNPLTTLPVLSNSLQTLYCFNNSLTALPALPNSLVSLLCSSNSLTSLPVLPNSLQYLECNNNSLTNLPSLPNGLLQLYCDSNNIACFPVFPNSLATCYISYNPFTCLPNYVLPAMSAYTTTPLCVAGNTNGCAFVGIKELSVGNNDISIYPNPANDFIYLSSDGIEFTNAEIINSIGKSVKKIELNLSEKKAEISIKTLARGIYVLKLNGSNLQTVSKRFVVEQ